MPSASSSLPTSNCSLCLGLELVSLFAPEKKSEQCKICTFIYKRQPDTIGS